jgi:heptosyltransferase-2/heptosyltransferase-3
MVLQTPLLHLLHHRYGHPCRLLTSGPWSTALFAHNPDVDEIWQLRARHAPLLLSPQRWRLVAALREHRGPIYVSEDSDRQLSKIRRLFRLGKVDPKRCVYLTDHVIEDQHWVERLLRFGAMTPSALSPEDNPASPRDRWLAPRLDVHPSDRSDRGTWLQQRGLAGRPLVLLQPGNKRAIKWGRPRAIDSKAWPIARWVALLRTMRCALPPACLLLCGSSAEEGLLREIRRQADVDGVEIGTSDLPLRRLLALMEIAHSMVAVDTGPAHMAAAVGCPLVILYGAESPRVWGRRSPMRRPVIELGGPPQYQAVEQIPLDLVIKEWSCLCKPAAYESNHRGPAESLREPEHSL